MNTGMLSLKRLTVAVLRFYIFRVDSSICLYIVISSQPLSALGQLYLGNWCQRPSLVCYSVSVTGYETEHKHISG